MDSNVVDPEFRTWFEVSHSLWPGLTERQFMEAFDEAAAQVGSQGLMGYHGSDKLRDALINILTKSFGPANLTRH